MSPLEYMIAHSNVMSQELQALDQWVIRDEQKRPINAVTGKLASPTDSTTWSSFAIAAATGRPLGFVFTGDDPYVGIDLDKCRDPETGTIAPEARSIIDRFSTYAEVSPSGTGIHLIGRGVKPADNCTRTFAWGKIECYDAGRYFTMTGRTLAGHDTIRNCQRELTAWHREVWPAEPKRAAPGIPTGGGVDDRDLIARLERDAKAGQLLAGNMASYPSPSEARGALAYKAIFYGADDPEQIVSIILGADLFRAGTPERERERKARRDAEGALARYTGPRYDPNHRGTPHLTIVPNANDDALSCPDVRAELAAERARNAELEARVLVLQERVRLADEREAVWRNTKLGAARQTGAALVSLFREERPKEPGTTTPYRMPLAKLADRTGLDEGTCSRHLKQLAEYRTPAGDPVLYADTRPIPRSVNQETGEVIEPHKEVWVGPGPIQHDAFGHVLATLAPKEAPQHGGRPDRNVCAKHPNAGVLRRTRNMRRITHECAHCGDILDAQVVPVGRESTEHLRSMAGPPDPIPHDAFADEPAAGRPIQQDAFADADPPAGPMPQHGSSIDTHVSNHLSGKMRHSPPAGQQSLLSQPTGPPLGWEDEHRRVYGEWYRGDGAA